MTGADPSPAVDLTARALLRAALGAYVLLFAAVALWGLDMDIPYWMFQLLPEDALRDRYLESLYHLHAQPPLLNALVGAALQVERVAGIDARTTLLVVHFFVGLAIVRAVTLLAVALVGRTWLRALAVLALLLDPFFWLALFQVFYPIHELFFLSLLAVAAKRCFSTGCPRAFAWCCLWTCGLVLTRSLFHPLWAVVVLWWIGRGRWRQVPVRWLGVASLGVLCLWPLKNQLEFGFFGYLSWLGVHVVRGYDVETPEVAAAFDFGDAPESVAARARARAEVPERYRQVPVLVDPVESPGIPNWNHHAMLAYGRTMLQRALAAMRDDPSAVIRKAATSYRHGYCLYLRRNSYTGQLDVRVLGTWLESWMRAHEAVTVLYLGDDTKEHPANGFRVAFPLVLLAVAWRLWVRRARSDPGWRLVVLLMLNVLWVLWMVLFVDGLEGNRMRFSTGPFLVLAVAWSLDGLLDVRARRRSARLAEAGPSRAAPRGPD